MKRREFITLVGSAAAWPAMARAQQADRMRRVGVLMNGGPADAERQGWLAAFLQTLRNLGWTEGQNLRVELRWNENNTDRTRAAAAELVRLAPDVISSAGSQNLAAMLGETGTIPIVFTQVSDPVAQGFVTTLARPGGNITGFTNFEASMAGKWLDLLKQVAPDIKRVALLFNPATSPQSKMFLSSVELAAPSFGVQVSASPVHERADIASAIDRFATQPNSGLIFPTDTFISEHRKLVVELVARARLPAIYAFREGMNDGGLMSYGTSFIDQYRQAAFYVDRILNGEKPADLPVQQPTKFEFVINMKAAKALGIEIPMSLLLTADEVIE
jgi:putative ABC transport system substrate-binding protein